MKKIMFNDRYGLTKAVLEGRKTMTRRIIPEKYNAMIEAASKGVLVVPLSCIPAGVKIEEFAEMWSKQSGRIRVVPVQDEPRISYHSDGDIIKVLSRYKPGEVVAVAQSLRDMGYDPRDTKHKSGAIWGLDHTPAWTNKMFVSASECIHQIRITNIRIERLQDISDEDCLNEGVFLGQFHTYSYAGRPRCPFNTPRDAFASLINRISGKGTWESNPWVFVYEFVLVK